MPLLATETIQYARGLGLGSDLLGKLAQGKTNLLTPDEADQLLGACNHFEAPLNADVVPAWHQLLGIAGDRLRRQSLWNDYHQARRDAVPISRDPLITPAALSEVITNFKIDRLSVDWRTLPYSIPAEVDPRLTVDIWAHREVISHRFFTAEELRAPTTRVLVALAPIDDFDNEVEFEGQTYRWNGYDFYEAMTFVNPNEERTTGPSPSYAIEFLRRNLPPERNVEFIVPRTLGEYQEALKAGFDLVCLSGVGKNTRVLLEMNRLAREQGVREVWLGNYAALGPYPALSKSFDRRFAGLGEEILYHHLVGPDLPPRRFHPEAERMLSTIQVVRPTSKAPQTPTSEIPVTRSPMTILHLATSLGCNRPCNYCAERFWSGGVQMLSEVDELKGIIDRAIELGAAHVYFLDPNLGITWQSGDEDHVVPQVVNHIAAKRTKVGDRPVTFSVLMEVDVIKKHGQYLVDRGLVKVFLGIESLSEAHASGDLSALGRQKQSIRETIDVVRWLQGKGVTVNGLYMQGTPGESEDHMMGGAQRLAELLETSQISTFTPFPGTDQFFTLAASGQIHNFDPDCGLFYGYTSAAFDGQVTDPAVGRRVFFRTHQSVNDLRRPNGSLDTALRRTKR